MEPVYVCFCLIWLASTKWPEFEPKYCLTPIYFTIFSMHCKRKYFPVYSIKATAIYATYTWLILSILHELLRIPWHCLTVLFGNRSVTHLLSHNPLVENHWMHKYMVFNTAWNMLIKFRYTLHVTHWCVYIHAYILFPHWQYIGPLWERIDKGDWEHFKQALILGSQEAAATHTSPV